MPTLVWLFLSVLLLLVDGNVLAGRGLICFSREVHPVGGGVKSGSCSSRHPSVRGCLSADSFVSHGSEPRSVSFGDEGVVVAGR